MEYIPLQVPVGRKVDRGKWYISEEAGACASVQPHDTQLPDNIHRTFRYSTFNFSCLTLNLKTNFPTSRALVQCLSDWNRRSSYTISNGFVNT